MSKHARTTLVLDRTPEPPKHSAGWTREGVIDDQFFLHPPYTPGKHAKPFGKHRADVGTSYTALRTAPALDIAA